MLYLFGYLLYRLQLIIFDNKEVSNTLDSDFQYSCTYD